MNQDVELSGKETIEGYWKDLFRRAGGSRDGVDIARDTNSGVLERKTSDADRDRYIEDEAKRAAEELHNLSAAANLLEITGLTPRSKIEMMGKFAKTIHDWYTQTFQKTSSGPSEAYYKWQADDVMKISEQFVNDIRE